MATGADIDLIGLDVDGVMTDGSILIDASGRESKRFHVRDGLAIKVAQRLGLGVAIVSGRTSEAVSVRAGELGVEIVIQGSADKSEALSEVVRRSGVDPSRMAFLGDDWPDLAIMSLVAYPMAVGDAEDGVRRAAAYVTARPGGAGAVREAIEHLLDARGLMDEARTLYH